MRIARLAPGTRRRSRAVGGCACAVEGRSRTEWRPPSISQGRMKTSEHVRGARSEGPRKLGLCVLCGLPAAGKSTFARVLSHRLRQEGRWAVGVVAYDDVMPDAFIKEASAPPLVRTEGAGPRRVAGGKVQNTGPCAVWEVDPWPGRRELD